MTGPLGIYNTAKVRCVWTNHPPSPTVSFSHSPKTIWEIDLPYTISRGSWVEAGGPMSVLMYTLCVAPTVFGYLAGSASAHINMARFPLDSWFANGGAVRFWHFRNKLKTIHIPLRTDRDTNMGTRWKRDEIDTRKCQLLQGPPHECSVIMQKTPWFWLQPDDSDVILFTALFCCCCCSVVAKGAYCSCYAIVYPNGMDTYLKERKSGAL